jgi:hypothetical protein
MYKTPFYLTLKKLKLHELRCLSLSGEVERHADKKAWGNDIAEDLDIM